MLGDGVVGSFPNSHGHYRSDGLARQERPCCRVETARHSLAVYVREREEGREGEGEWESPVGAYDGRAIWDAKTSESKDWRT